MATVSPDDTDILFRSARPPDRTEVTGPARTDVYDVWEPTPERARGITVALVHGGFWREEYDRTHLAPLAEALARDGFHVANLEYPRVGMDGGGWPGTGEAVRARMESVQADTDLPDRVVAVGHSAGGHLALWLASSDRLPWLTGALALGPCADLREVDRLGLSERRRPRPPRRHAGGASAGLGRRRPGRPAPHRRRPSSSPGEFDDVVPASVTEAYVASRAEGEPLTTAVARRADHFDVIDPATDAYLLLLAEVEELTLR